MAFLFCSLGDLTWKLKQPAELIRCRTESDCDLVIHVFFRAWQNLLNFSQALREFPFIYSPIYLFIYLRHLDKLAQFSIRADLNGGLYKH